MLSLTIVLLVLELNSICIATCQLKICIHMVLRVFMSIHTLTTTGYPCTYYYNKLGKTLFVVIGLWGFQKIRYYLSCIGLSCYLLCTWFFSVSVLYSVFMCCVYITTIYQPFMKYYMSCMMLMLGKRDTRFKRTLIYKNTNTQSANIRGNPLCQGTKRHLIVKG